MNEVIRFAPNTLADSDIVWLYREGVEFNSVTGGWIQNPLCGGAGLATKDTDKMYCKVQGNTSNEAAYGFRTNNKVTLSGITTLKMNVRYKRATAHSYVGQAWLTLDSTLIVGQEGVTDPGGNSTASTYNGVSVNSYTEATMSLNVSSLNGTYNIHCFVRDAIRNPAGGADANCEMEILKIWGEK